MPRAVASIEATEAATSVDFHNLSYCSWKLYQ